MCNPKDKWICTLAPVARPASVLATLLSSIHLSNNDSALLCPPKGFHHQGGSEVAWKSMPGAHTSFTRTMQSVRVTTVQPDIGRSGQPALCGVPCSQHDSSSRCLTCDGMRLHVPLTPEDGGDSPQPDEPAGAKESPVAKYANLSTQQRTPTCQSPHAVRTDRRHLRSGMMMTW